MRLARRCDLRPRHRQRDADGICRGEYPFRSDRGRRHGGSGVGVLLEIARQLSQKESKLGIDIILFDAEDYGQPEDSKFPIKKDSWCLGSQYWSQNPHKKNYFARYGILLDMVGGKNATFYLEGNSSHYAANILQKVWEKGHQLGFGRNFINPGIKPNNI